MDELTEDCAVYHAVLNDEEQYSIWWADRPLPPGWREAGKAGSKSEVLEYIRCVWTDIRPLSVRRQLEQAENASSAFRLEKDS